MTAAIIGSFFSLKTPFSVLVLANQTLIIETLLLVALKEIFSYIKGYFFKTLKRHRDTHWSFKKAIFYK